MSPYFIEQFTKQYACSKCKDAPRTGRHKHCQHILKKARETWLVWSVARRLKGRCSYCAKRAVKGELRCKIHKEYNRKKCYQWHALHGKKHDAKEKKRKEQLLDSRLCICAAHNPVVPGGRRCLECRTLGQAKRQSDRATILRIREARSARKLAKLQAVLDHLAPRYRKVLDRAVTVRVF